MTLSSRGASRAPRLSVRWPTAAAAVVVTLLAVAAGPLGAVTDAAATTAPGAGEWALTEAPLPSGASSATNVRIQSISCPAAGSCVAVGTYSYLGQESVMAETLSGGSWSATNVAPVDGTLGLPYLATISCLSAGYCVAVGRYTDPTAAYPAVEVLSTGAWKGTTLPVPSDAAATEGGFLTAVACTAVGSCTAVGYYKNGTGVIEALSETLSGGAWSPTSLPLPANATTTVATQTLNLQSLSCPSAGFCVAVGYYPTITGTYEGVIETLSGGHWDATTLAGDTSSDLMSVSCPAVGDCVAAGGKETSASVSGLLATLATGVWSGSVAPLPANAATATPTYAFVNGVDCPAIGACVAVGTYEDTTGHREGLAETLSGGAWSATGIPDPTGIGTGTENYYYRKLSCATAGSCAAVGAYTNAEGHGVGLIDELSRGAWTTTTTSDPTGAGILMGVSCAPSGFCAAGGYDGTGLTVTGTATAAEWPTYRGVLATYVPLAPRVSTVSPTSGPLAGGTTVTITGTGFFPGSRVTFGSVPATSVTYVSPTELEATAPAGSGTVDVTVTTTGGTSSPSTSGQFTYVQAAPPPPVPPGPPTPVVTRVYGETADATAAAEFTRAFPSTRGACPASRAAVVASTAEYQDALASQFLAQWLTTGTLLTPTTTLAPVTAATLEDEGISTVYVVGGPLAVTTAVVHALEALTADTCDGKSNGTTAGKIVVHRVSGENQYGTAEAVAELVGTAASKAFPGAYATTDATGGSGRYNDTAGTGSGAPAGSVRTAILTSGTEFQDAEAASVVSYRTKLPLLLTPPTSLSATALSAIEKLGVAQVILVGGPLAVSAQVEQELVQKAGLSVLRVAGKDYTDTARELARFEVGGSGNGLGWKLGVRGRVMVARGNGFTDGIAGAVLDSPHNATTGGAGTARPLLLAESPTEIGTYLASFLKTTGPAGIDGTSTKTVSALTVLGGPQALSTAVVAQMEADLTE